MSPMLPYAVALGLAALLFASLEVGFRVGRARSRSGVRDERSQLGAVQGATLGLLGLLLGFSFAGASGRFVERQDLVTREVNAIGTAWLRAELLPEPHRGELRSALREYARLREAMFGDFRAQALAERSAEAEAMHTRLWASAIAGVGSAPALAVPVLGPVNEVIDLHTVRATAQRKHLPAMALGALAASAMCTLGVLGFGAGLTGGRALLLNGPFVFLVWMALWLTIDLDYPRRGLIRINQEAMSRLVDSLGR